MHGEDGTRLTFTLFLYKICANQNQTPCTYAATHSSLCWSKAVLDQSCAETPQKGGKLHSQFLP